MTHVILLMIIVLLMLVTERIVFNWATQNPAGQKWIRRIPVLHPNGISLIRMPMGIITTCLVARGHWTMGILWFSFWMITDLTDGTIARNCNLTSEMGKWLDPLSDKFMYFPILLFFALSDSVNPNLPLWGVIAFIIIDTLGQASRLFSKKKAANSFGKAKTALVTILLATMAFNQMPECVEPFLSQTIVNFATCTCLLLAFLSFFCKVIPDNWYANCFTLANFLCGCGAIYYIFNNKYTFGFVMIFIGQFFDLFDGRLARKYGSTKRGAFFDDVADATSFGLATGCLIFRALAYDEDLITVQVAALITLFYVGCLLYRLYRFLKPTRVLPQGVFQGLPSPAGALLAGSTVLACLQFKTNISGLVSALVVVAASILMVSNIPYCHFGRVLWPRLPRFAKMLLFILCLILANVALVYRSHWEQAFIAACVALSIFYTLGAIASAKNIRLLETEMILERENSQDKGTENSEG